MRAATLGFVTGRSVVLAIVLALVLMSASSLHAATDQKASAFVLCKNQKNVRTIKILPSTPPGPPSATARIGCAVSYAKGGQDEVVGTNRSLETCKSILKSIQYNLETSKWSCRNVSTAVVTTSGSF